MKRFINADIVEQPLPSVEDIAVKKQEKLSAKVAKILDSGEYRKFGEQVDRLAQAHGCDVRDIACALAQIISSKDKKLVPAFKGPVASDRAAKGGKRVVLSVDIGRSQRIAPNFIVGAIVDATGLSPRTIGKIDIFDEQTLIEMYENDALFVLENMEGTKIKGQDVHFALSASKPRPRRFADGPAWHDSKPSSYRERDAKPRRGAKFSADKPAYPRRKSRD